jgi:hypothetical protein
MPHKTLILLEKSQAMEVPIGWEKGPGLQEGNTFPSTSGRHWADERSQASTQPRLPHASEAVGRWGQTGRLD